ncbi:unnamed protein product [Diatraea saccharalis]|nr:unnamed protein product [Diatraea saccharalis]
MRRKYESDADLFDNLRRKRIRKEQSSSPNKLILIGNNDSWNDPFNESVQSNSSNTSQPPSKQVLHFRRLLKDQLTSVQVQQMRQQQGQMTQQQGQMTQQQGQMTQQQGQITQQQGQILQQQEQTLRPDSPERGDLVAADVEIVDSPFKFINIETLPTNSTLRNYLSQVGSSENSNQEAITYSVQEESVKEIVVPSVYNSPKKKLLETNSPPPILRRKPKKLLTPNPNVQMHAISRLDSRDLSSGVTPIKALPFSPSQFLNSPAGISFAQFDSTPLRHTTHKEWSASPLLNTPTPGNPNITPGNATIRNNTPKTPTPFKIAMAEIGKKSGLNYEPSSPGLLVEDITEMIKREENSETTVHLNDSLLSAAAEHEANNQVNDSGIGSLKRRCSEGSQGKENLPGVHKKARKALATSWGTATSTPHSHTLVPEVAFIVETPSKTLAGDSSVMFSPPSIVKHSLLEESTSLHSLMSTENTPETSKYEDLDIEAVISEKTKVQHGSSYPTNPTPNTLPDNELILYQNMYENQNVFRDVTNLESPRSFARLNADRLRTIHSSNDLASENNLIAPKEVLANVFADHIYKVTNQKPSTSRIDEILTNKMMGNGKSSEYGKENQWWQMENKDTGQTDSNIFTNEYYIFNDGYVE